VPEHAEVANDTDDELVETLPAASTAARENVWFVPHVRPPSVTLVVVADPVATPSSKRL
jgi:hypothetical protein